MPLQIEDLRTLAGILILSDEEGASADTPADLTFDFAKLGPPLETLMGRGGFKMLLQNALTLSQREMPWLLDVRCKNDGSFEGFEQVGEINREDFIKGQRHLLAHILRLLVRFIGPGMTRAIVLDSWSQVADHDVELGEDI